MTGIINIRVPDTSIGLGAINSLGDAAKSFKPAKTLVITDPGLVKAGVIDAVKAPLEKSGLKFDVFSGCKEEPPISLVAEVSRKIKEGSYDLLIGVGGGSSMDTAKVASLLAYTGMTIDDYIKTPFHNKINGRVLPKIVAPTTAGTGAEWSIVAPVYAEAPVRRAFIIHAWDNLPNKVIVDPALTLGLPQRITADTGMDALTHAIEAYTSSTANVFSDMLASTAIKLIGENLRSAYAKGRQSVEARYHMAIAASLAMNAVTSGGIGLAHFMNETMGVKAKIPHGAAVAMLLPAVMEYNMISNPAKFAKVAELLGEKVDGLSVQDAAAKAAEAVRKLIRDLGLPTRLSQVGLRQSDIAELAKLTYEIDRPVIEAVNPRDATEADIARIFESIL